MFCRKHEFYSDERMCDECAGVTYPVTDFVDRVEPDVDKLKQRIFELERILSVIHEQSKI